LPLALRSFSSEPANLKLIKKLNKAGVHPTAEKRKVKSDKFAGKSFVFTGGLANALPGKKRRNRAAARRQSLWIRQQED